ncbi:MAG: hypothetical protein Q9227_000900 [Pyrenula ochraceoflavens]
MPSDIRVFVQWTEPSIFAGEDVECTITFKNVSNPQEVTVQNASTWHSRRQNSISSTQTLPIGSEHRRSPSTSRLQGQYNNSGQQQGRHHRAASSLSIPSTPVVSPRSPALSTGGRSNASSPHIHQRSISIVSLGSGETGRNAVQNARIVPVSRPGNKHNRSASLQVLPRQVENQHGSHFSASLGSSQSQRTQSISTQKDKDAVKLTVPQAPSRRGSRQSSYSTSPTVSQSGSRRSSPLSNPSFKFPQQSLETRTENDEKPRPRIIREQSRSSIKQPLAALSSGNLKDRLEGHLASRVLSGVSVDENPRDSGEFYNMSDQSSDTLASEQVPLETGRLFNSLPQANRLRTNLKPRIEKLLMGYVQVGATFTVDGALVDQSHFEEVKRKGFLGGQGGGGVVGVETPRVPGGMFGGFSLSSIGESIGGLLGSSEMSSTKEMRGVTASRAIPLLSTPQSLLFVDLQLGPGEEKSFHFAYPIPRGLPATYKGKAIKISYHLTIGTQWSPGQEKTQKVRQVNVPFRVFSGVNVDGQILGHDLMQPYVILQDRARKRSITPDSEREKTPSQNSPKQQPDFHSAFMSYASSLLDPKIRRQSSTGTFDDLARFTPKPTTGPQISSTEAINLAILRSNQTSSSSDRSQNRFDIARNGKRVGAVILNRPLHRLGETVVAAIDLSHGNVPVFAIRCMLETVEKVDPSIAVRSETSISRVTRRVHIALSENAIYAQSVVFSPTIPVAASPTLLTSAIELEWRLRFEFATVRAGHEDEFKSRADFLEEIGKDERGVSLAAVETMPCETFEVAISITVFGDTVKDSGEDEDTVGFPI